ncbi:MAG: DUF4832 domain-containing protein [Puia sp.]|nr:DUF4832 domain-containing protein [Puia sp.]
MKNCTRLLACCLALVLPFCGIHAQGTTIKYTESKTEQTAQDPGPGYRFVLQEAYFPDHAVAGHMFAFKVHLENKGYISPAAGRPVLLVLRNVETGKEYSVKCQADIRKWTTSPGGFDWREMLKLPASMPPGKYSLYLAIPSKYGTLAKDPQYSIRLANESCWEEDTGYNRMNYILTVLR